MSGQQTVTAPPPSPRRSSLAAGLVAIAAQILLLDAAMETFAAASPLRGWLVPPILLFVALSIWGWRPAGPLARRASSAGAAAWSVGGVLALVALSAWLPGGQINGVRLLLQPTPAILLISTIAAVALAAFVLTTAAARFAAMPRLVAVCLVGLLALYAVAALIMALRDATAYTMVFGGYSAWLRLPMWLQGAWLGAFVLVPLALLSQGVRLVDRRRRGQPVGALGWQVAVLLAALVTTISTAGGFRHQQGVGPSPLAPDATAKVPPPTRPLAPEELSQLAGQMEQSFDRLAARERELSRESFDPEAIVTRIGHDPQKLFEFVRDQTDWVPYQGALRGAAGVLSDRLGSSLDRTMLLADLLSRAGHGVRLAHAVLDEGQARKLGSLVRQTKAASSSPAAGNRQTREAVGALAATIQAAVWTGGQGAGPDRRVADAADHWWVQLQTTAGWTDVDPATPDARFGQPSFAQAKETFPWNKTEATSGVPAQFIHQVILRVVVERWERGKLAERPVFRIPLQPMTLREAPVLVRHAPLRKAGADATSDQDRTSRAALLAQTQWVPVLVINGRNFVQHGFDAAGNKVSKPRPGKAAAIGEGAAGLLGGLGGGLGGGETEEQAATSALTAEWLEYEIRAPGRPPRTIRREIFDMIGPAARASGLAKMPQYSDEQRIARVLALAGGVESLMISSRPTREWFLHLLYRSELSQRDQWRQILAEPDIQKRELLIAGLTGPSVLHAYALGRHLLNPMSEAAFVDSVNIANQRVYYTSDAGQLIHQRRLIDIVTNDVGTRAVGIEAARARLHQGVADTAAEHIVLGGSVGHEHNTFALFMTPPSGARVIAIRDPRDAPIGRLPFTPDVRARIAGDLALGYTVALYDQAWNIDAGQRTAWWRVHPASGEAVGVTDEGHHGDTGEYGEITELVDITEEDFEATTIGKTQVCYRGGLSPMEFWSQHATRIADQLGYEWNEEVMNYIVDMQWKVLRGSLTPGI